MAAKAELRGILNDSKTLEPPAKPVRCIPAGSRLDWADRYYCQGA